MSKSLRGSINAFCRSCLYDPREPGRWREQITACTAKGCPLYEVRPTTGARRGAAKPPDSATFEPWNGRILNRPV